MTPSRRAPDPRVVRIFAGAIMLSLACAAAAGARIIALDDPKEAKKHRPAPTATHGGPAATTAAHGGSKVALDRLLVHESAPAAGMGLYPKLTGTIDLAGAAEHLFGNERDTAWLTQKKFVDGFQRTWVTPEAPRRIISTTVYRFAERGAPRSLAHVPAKGETRFEVPDFGGYVTTGTDSTIATSDRVGTFVPDFVVRLDIAEYLFFVEVSGPKMTAAEAIELARRQYERARALLPHVR